ncbi:MAG: hypothetical protein J6C08_00140 [Campylobacter sp.]|uniref:phage baseplate protein n=1 Tax=Campylobacter sp. TaxID=205 RepID=UPI001B064A15|nr:hypothetical protein [Campylobacter sp.]MBO5062909.1 hypothetical protein [Campylobacter sp.]
MATSGSFTTTAYSNRSLTFSWSRSSYSIADNTTTISWSLKGSGSQTQYFKAGGFTVVIDGETVYSTSTDTRIQLSNGTLVASGTKTIKHNADGSRSFSASASGGIFTYAVNCSGSGSWDLNSIPRAATITAAPNFTDEDNPTITYSNPAGSNVTKLEACISLTGAIADIPYREISKTGTSYTFELTEEERNTLRNATLSGSATRDVMFFVATTIGGTIYRKTSTKTLTIVNATPTFTSSVEDTRGTSTALTGSTVDNVSMIKGFNYMACSMEATAYKGASITRYKITNGANAVEAAAAYFDNSESNTFKFEVWDSRGNYNSYTTTIPMIDYIPLTTNVDGKIVLSTSDSTKATVSFTAQGNCFKGNFGAVDNSLAIDYTVADTEGNVAANDVVEIALNGNTYSIDIDIEDLDYRKSYVVYVKATDAIKSMQANSKTLKAIPIFDWGENDFNFNVPITIQGVTLLDIFYPIGSIYQSIEYFNPAERMGGEWEQLTDRFLLGAGDTFQAGTTGGEVNHTLTTSEIPSHAHSFVVNIQHSDGATTTGEALTSGLQVGGKSRYTGSTYGAGGGGAHNNMPPYLVVYMWQRVA